MMKRTLKRRLLRARITLNQTIQKILDINRRRKKLIYYPNPEPRQQELDEELRILNKIVQHQAKLIQHYESSLSNRH